MEIALWPVAAATCLAVAFAWEAVLVPTALKMRRCSSPETLEAPSAASFAPSLPACAAEALSAWNTSLALISDSAIVHPFQYPLRLLLHVAVALALDPAAPHARLVLQ